MAQFNGGTSDLLALVTLMRANGYAVQQRTASLAAFWAPGLPVEIGNQVLCILSKAPLLSFLGLTSTFIEPCEHSSKLRVLDLQLGG